MANDNMKVKPIKKETLSEKIIIEIKNLIDSGQITPGSRLPSEREFAAMLGVSRPSLREALKALSILGIIINKQGEGNFLSENNDPWPIEPLSLFFSFKKGALIDIIEARKGLEMHAVALASERRTIEDVSNIKAILKNMRGSLNDYKAFLHHDMDFHLSIGMATKNEIIIDLMEKIQKISFNTRDTLWKTADHIEINIHSDLAKHEKLLEFIVASDAQNASKCIAQHLDELLERLKRGVTRGED
jgi:GntR family transcriptional regulator, transcriptional repressor for pyruvate dehydrogenase complex